MLLDAVAFPDHGTAPSTLLSVSSIALKLTLETDLSWLVQARSHSRDCRYGNQHGDCDSDYREILCSKVASALLAELKVELYDEFPLGILCGEQDKNGSSLASGPQRKKEVGDASDALPSRQVHRRGGFGIDDCRWYCVRNDRNGAPKSLR
jgi:hypothetical protein